MKIPRLITSMVIQMNYKSGISVVREFQRFDVETKNGSIVTIDWACFSTVKPIYINVDAIESIFQIGTKCRIWWGEI